MMTNYLFLLAQFLGTETKGEEGFDALDDIDFGVGAEEEFDGRTVARLTLADDLTAGAARSAYLFAELVALTAYDG